MDSFVEKISHHFNSGTPFLMINTDEESRVVKEIQRAALLSYSDVPCNVPSTLYTSLKTILRDVPVNTPLGQKAASDVFLLGPNKVIVPPDVFMTVLTDLKMKCDASDGVKRKTYQAQVEALMTLRDTICRVVEWDCVGGFVPEGDFKHLVDEALAATITARFPGDTIFVFKDCQQHLTDDINARRMVRSLFADNRLAEPCEDADGNLLTPRRMIIFVQPDMTLHRDLKACVSLVEFDLPNEHDLDHEITKIATLIDKPEKRICPPELRQSLVASLRGFTQAEAENTLAYCVAKHKGFVPEVVETVQGLQKAAFAKDRVLTLIDRHEIQSADQVGGFENAIEFAERAKICFSPEARKLGLRRPKGCLLLGIPGTGKTLFGRVLARILDLPLIVYDVGAQFGSLVGDTEAATRAALKKIKAKGPCVLLIDEADKVFSGSAGGAHDSGVSTRMLGYILTFMATENEEAFVVMTMNRTIGIPKEMLRAGRLDALFYTTFPNSRERLDILGIHLKKNGADLKAYTDAELEQLVLMTKDYVGAEIEQLVIEAVRMAFLANRTLTPTVEQLHMASKFVTPVAQLDKEEITAMNAYCATAAKPVSKQEDADVESKVFAGPPGAGRRQIRTGS